MPISTPARMVEEYDNDFDHFAHVLDHLFIPAIENIGLKPISPLTVGSPVIHTEIIKQIADTQLLLCDMSTLNANVFFELGIRTALDLPVCLVQDTLTENLPFDINLVNHHRYNPRRYQAVEATPDATSCWDSQHECGSGAWTGEGSCPIMIGLPNPCSQHDAGVASTG
jgi:hypothetical protein